MRVTVVDFAAAYGDKEQNLRSMEQVLERCAGKTDLVLFPELCLTGYENQREVPWAEKMQVRLAEEVPGSATERLGALCRGLGLWTVFGLPVRRGGRVQRMHREAVSLVCAHAQAEAFGRIEPHLTEAEAAVARRARNAHQNPPRHADPAEYHRATALEALIGYLYLTGQQARMEELIRKALPEDTEDADAK